QQGLLTLLDAQRDGGAMSLPCYDPVERAGAYVDLAGARIYGLKYYGAATARVLEQTQELIAPSPFSILMLHTGLLGQVPHMHGGLSAGQLDALRPRVDYLALGHIHKHLIRDRWVCNPGSPETVSFEEAEWFHGFLDVTVEDGNAAITPVTTKSRRPFVRIHVLADGCRSLDDFMERVEEKAAAAGIPAGSVVEVSLQGVAEFRRQDVPLEALQMAVQARFDPLTVRVRNGLTPAGTLRTRASERESRSELDRRVVEHLIDAAGQSYQAADWVDLILDIKGMAAEHQDAASIAAHLEDALSHRSQSRPVVASVEPAPSRASKETFDPAQLDW
ncbi:MAG: metallophosphoesterase family protein, partial [Chloroflexota bacterium]